MTSRISKAPEERKQELIEVATKLFESRGYENVSVRDILSEVNGAPGMFYYYFKSKEDIFLACMECYFSERLKVKVDILKNKEIAYEVRIKTLRELIVNDINQFAQRFDFSADNSITDNSYRLWELMHYIGHFVEAYADFIIEGVETQKIKNCIGVTKENARNIAAFILYGATGTIYNDSINGIKEVNNPDGAFDIISEIFT
ncbi:TetR/AcrR family transcriptional regulator [Mogibacterium timidum]